MAAAAALIVIAAWTGVPWSLPAAAVLPVVAPRWRGTSPWRWSLVVLVVSTIAIGITGARAAGTVPFSAWIVGSVDAWLDGRDGAVPGLAWMGVVTAAFVLALRYPRGVALWAVLAVILCAAALIAIRVYGQAANLFAAFPVAYPPWELLLIAGMIRMMTRPRYARTPSGFAGLATAGVVLIALAFVIRLALAPFYGDLVRAVISG